MDCSLRGSSVHEILQSRRLPFPTPGDHLHPRIEPGSPAFQADSLPTELPGKSQNQNQMCLMEKFDWINSKMEHNDKKIFIEKWIQNSLHEICSPVLIYYNTCHNCYWRRQWQPSPVLLTGKSHGWRSLVGCIPRGCEESEMTEQLHFHFSLSCIGSGNGNPLQRSCLENPRDGGAWWAAIYGVAQSRTQLKWLSSSSSSIMVIICIFWLFPNWKTLF